MAKHLIDVDERALSSARAELGTTTIRDSVNGALVLAARSRRERVETSLAVSASVELDDREDAWR